MDGYKKEFNYYFRCQRYLFPLVFSLACAIFLLYKAGRNEKGLIIQGIIRLRPDHASLFYMILGVLMMIISLGFILSSVLIRKKITLGTDAVIIPNLLTGTLTSVYYRDIAYVTDQTISKQRLATIVTKDKKQYSINRNALDTENDFNEILAFLKSAFAK